MSNKSVAPPRRTRNELPLTREQERLLQRLAAEQGLSSEDLLRRLETRREFGTFDFETNSAALERAAERALEAKRASNKRAEELRQAKLKPGQQRRTASRQRVRTPDENAPKGYREAVAWDPPTPVERAIPTTEDREMSAKLRQLLSAGAPFDPASPFGDGEVIWASNDIESRMRARAGTAPVSVLKKIRAAYKAAFELLPSQQWQSSLRGRVMYVIHYRLAGDAPPHGPNNGRTILAALRRDLGVDRLPKTLTAARIEQVLQTSTLTRGGGRRPKKNVGVALEELITEIETQA